MSGEHEWCGILCALSHSMPSPSDPKEEQK